MKSGNLNFLEPSGPLQACNGTALLFTYEYSDNWATKGKRSDLMNVICICLYTSTSNKPRHTVYRMPEVFCWRPPVIRKWQLGATESVQIVVHRVQGTFHISLAMCGNYSSISVEHVCNDGEDTQCYWEEPRKLLYPGWQQHSILNSCLSP